LIPGMSSSSLEGLLVILKPPFDLQADFGDLIAEEVDVGQ
jgi:hypothetical protein